MSKNTKESIITEEEVVIEKTVTPVKEVIEKEVIAEPVVEKTVDKKAITWKSKKIKLLCNVLNGTSMLKKGETINVTEDDLKNFDTSFYELV